MSFSVRQILWYPELGLSYLKLRHLGIDSPFFGWPPKPLKHKQRESFGNAND